MAYLYRHIRHDKNEPFYIGIGSDSTYKRAKAKYKGCRNKIWYDVVAKSKYDVEIVFDGIDWGFACEKEKEFIALYGRKDNGSGILANMTDGGEGVLGFSMIRTKESIQKQSNTLKKKLKDDSEYRQRHLMYLKEGSKNRKYGIESESIRKKKSESHKLRYKEGAIPSSTGKFGSLSNRARKVICIETNKIWGSVVDCALENNIKKQYLTKLLNGTIKTNKTTFRYYGNK
jgi:hypothetical protein